MIDHESLAILDWEGTLHDFLWKTARIMARGQPGLTEDLYQEALIRLWELDPARFDEEDAGFLKSALRDRMIDVARRERSRRFWDRSKGGVGRHRTPLTRRRRTCA